MHRIYTLGVPLYQSKLMMHFISSKLMMHVCPDIKNEHPNRSMHTGKMDAAMKKIATEKAQLGVQEMLREILDWDMFNLKSLELPQLSSLPERLPISFESTDDFKRSGLIAKLNLLYELPMYNFIHFFHWRC